MSPAAAKEVKEEAEEGKSKAEKRKKSDGSSKTEKEPSSKQIKVKSGDGASKSEDSGNSTQPVNLYQEILEREAKESKTRSASSDYALWTETCSELRGMMKEIFELKCKKSPAADITEKRIQASLLFVTLKKLNRLEKLRLKSIRDATNASKQSVDSFNLQLQNLLYEVLHLRKEVDKCINFKSADESLNLVSEQEFYKEAPEDISRPKVTGEDPHALRLARLQWELQQRKELGESAVSREAERDKVETGVRQREARGRELQPQLAAILEASLPVQQFLGMELTRSRQQHKLANLLPKPLYMLFTQVSAYSSASDPLLSVEVVGDEGEARKAREEMAKGDTSVEEDGNGEQDSVDKEGDAEGDGRAAKKRRDKKSKSKEEQEKRSKALAFFPLTVKMKLSLAEREDSLCLEFSHLTSLDLVSVSVSLSLESGSKLDTGGVALEVSSILSCLYPGDTGIHSPSPATDHQLAAMGLTGPLSSLLGNVNRRVYTWANTMCGLTFLPQLGNSSEGERGQGSVSKLHLETTISLLRSRLEARLSLQGQLDALSKIGKSVSLSLLLPQPSPLPSKVVSRLKSWSLLDWESYSSAPVTKPLTEAGDAEPLVTDSHSLYRAVVVREGLTLTALLALPPSFPQPEPAGLRPLFSLSLESTSTGEPEPGCPTSHPESLRLLEAELNTGPVAAGTQDLVSRLHTLMLAMDALVDCKEVRGRTRSHPVVFNMEAKAFLHI